MYRARRAASRRPSRSPARFLTRVGVSLVRLAALVCLATGAPLLAHDEPQEEIDRLSEQIARYPIDAELYLARGGLYRATGHLEAALADYNRVLALDPEHPEIEFYRGQVLYEAGEYRQAYDILDRFLSEHPAHLQGLMVRARSLRQLDQPLLAARDYSQVISQMAQPSPIFYLERADALAAAGDEHLGAAIESLDEGMARLGPLILLQSRAIDLEVRARRYDAALARIDQILSGMPRKEGWLTRRGEILAQAGRVAAARESYAQALGAIAELPSHQAQAPAIKALADDLKMRLDSVPEVSGGTD